MPMLRHGAAQLGTICLGFEWQAGHVYGGDKVGHWSDRLLQPLWPLSAIVER
jgi:hypothetical protein